MNGYNKGGARWPDLLRGLWQALYRKVEKAHGTIDQVNWLNPVAY